jgi:hypothetical protein
MENHSGKGGQRYELLELLAWLEGVRKIQRKISSGSRGASTTNRACSSSGSSRRSGAS